MRFKLIGGPYDGMEGGHTKTVGSEVLWVRPDPEWRGPHGVLLSRTPKPGAARYELDQQQGETNRYVHEGLKLDSPLDRIFEYSGA